jgi:very-short-patch-repair endonuclease
MKGRVRTHRTAGHETVRFSRELRRELTAAERLLWHRLRRKNVGGFRFRRQHPIGPYIADFFCNEAGLVIEVDGGIHAVIEVSERDRLRDHIMREYGLTVLRVTNRDVMTDIDGVVASIERALAAIARGIP